MQAISRRRSKLGLAALLLAMAVGLSGCFDLTQKVEIDRGGAGHYRMAISARGLVGAALKEKPVTFDNHAAQHGTTTIVEKNGRVTQTTAIAFKSLSKLRLSDEAISLRVLGRSWFGLGPAHVRFRRTFLVGNARRANQDRVGRGDEMGAQILASMFGDHTYVFAVTLPGSILRIAPLKLGGVLVVPTVTGDFYHGHTVTWTMPLSRALSRKMMTFEVDFSAYGSFSDVHSMPEGATTL